MKKEKLLRQIGGALLALTMVVSPIGAFGSETGIVAEAAGGESFDTAIEIPANMDWGDWNEIGVASQDFYKVTLPTDGKFKICLMIKNTSHMEVDVFNSSDTEKRVMNTGQPNVDDSPWTGTDTKELSAGTYYIRVKSESRRDSSKNQSYKLKTVFEHFAAPESGKVTKVKSTAKKKAEVTFKEVTGVNGYEIQYSTSKKFAKNVKTKSFEVGQTRIAGNNKRKVTIGKLKRHKKYYFRIRTYAEHNNTRYYSDWSKAKSAKIK